VSVSTVLPVVPATASSETPAQARRGNRRISPAATVLLLLGALYCLFPVLWVLIASSKSAGELFSTFTLAPSGHLFDNISDLSHYRDGLYWRWMVNTALYAGVGAFGSTFVSAMAGFALAKYTFPGKRFVFNLILAGVLVPKLPDLATAVAKIAVSGYWLTEAMKSVFIDAEGPIRIISTHTGTLIDMTAEPAAYGAAIVIAHALAFLLIAYLVTLMRHARHSSRS